MNNKNYVKLLQFVRDNWTGLKYRNANGKTWSSDDSKYPSLTDTEIVERFLNDHPLAHTEMEDKYEKSLRLLDEAMEEPETQKLIDEIDKMVTDEHSLTDTDQNQERKEVDKPIPQQPEQVTGKDLIDAYNITEDLARFLHDTYEEAAKQKGWDTQDSCKVEFKDLPLKNKQTMIAVAGKLLQSKYLKPQVNQHDASLDPKQSEQPEQQADGGELSRVATYINGDCFLLDKYKGKTVAVIPYELHEQAVQQEREIWQDRLKQQMMDSSELCADRIRSNTKEYFGVMHKQEAKIKQLQSQLEQTKARKVKWPSESIMSAECCNGLRELHDFEDDDATIINICSDEWSWFMTGWTKTIEQFKRLNPEAE